MFSYVSNGAVGDTQSSGPDRGLHSGEAWIHDVTVERNFRMCQPETEFIKEVFSF